MNGPPWTLNPADNVTLYLNGRPFASGTISNCGFWLKVHGISSIRMNRLRQFSLPFRLVPRRNPHAYADGEREH